MQTLLESNSTLTERFQTTIPAEIRKALGLRKQDKLRYSLNSAGDVVLSRVQDDAGDDAGEDEAIGAFLDFLAQDMADNPTQVQGFGADLQTRLAGLVDGVEINLDAPLDDDGT